MRALFIVSFVPLDFPSQKATILSLLITISLFLIGPALLPYFIQSGKNIKVSILFLYAYCSASLSAPITPLEIILSISYTFH